MSILSNKDLDLELLYDELLMRREAPWNNGRINDRLSFPELNKLFKLINSGTEKESFFYQGNLFRIHQGYSMLYDDIDMSREVLCGSIYDDGSCYVLPVTKYDEKLVAYSLSPDFARDSYYKVRGDETAVIIHANTKDKYGIYGNELIRVLGGQMDKFYEEYEVLFPLSKKYVVKEYETTPNRFRYYKRAEGKTGAPHIKTQPNCWGFNQQNYRGKL